MKTTMAFGNVVVVECADVDALRLPEPDHFLDYQTGTVRLEFPRTPVALVALRLAGVDMTLLETKGIEE